MIELLIIILAVKYRHGFTVNDEEYDPLVAYGGLDFEPPERKRPELKIVK